VCGTSEGSIGSVRGPSITSSSHDVQPPIHEESRSGAVGGADCPVGPGRRGLGV
jgi:hypothetical protein